MNAFLFAIATGLLVTSLGWAVAYAARVWRRLRLWRLSLVMRRAIRGKLSSRFDHDYAGRRRWLGGRATRHLANSFRFAVSSKGGLPSEASRREFTGGLELLRCVQRRGAGAVHLINAESGYGKTVLGLTLTLLQKLTIRERLLSGRFAPEGLVPLYLNLGDVDSDEPLAELERMLERLRDETEPWGRPLFVFDSLNETVSPEYFAEELADRGEELRALGAQFLFLFSFRHHSYPSRLRLALLEQGFDQIESVELLFDVGDEGDLEFLPHLIGDGPRRGPAELRRVLEVHAARSPLISFSRHDVRRYLSWRRSNGPDQDCPSPADLCVAEILGEQPVSLESLVPLARAGFLLLGQERKAATYQHIAERTGLTRKALQAAAVAHPEVPVCCGDRHFRIEGETAVRVLGALEVGRRLLKGSRPDALRGRTIYDACAPYVPAALSWLAPDDQTGIALDRFDEPIRRAIKGRHAPYSFYATVLCSDDGGVLGNGDGSLDRELFEQLISAIDEDRLQTCGESLLTAGRQEPELLLDPVLDQLFEVMAAYGDRAVNLLLGILDNPDPLIRSQAAYLLLDWVRSAVRNPSPESQELLELIPERMSVDDGNLHFRFHQVEILESLRGVFSSEEATTSGRTGRLLVSIGADGGDTVDAIAGHSEFQALVSLYAGTLIGPRDREAVAICEQLTTCISLLPTDERFWETDEADFVEANLECWEVCLGMAARMCKMARQNLPYAAFLEQALDHDLWIIRWWAFAGIAGLVVAAAEAGEGTLARRWAARVIQQLHDGVEPIGVKHRQCALIRQLRDDEGAAARIVREALLAVTPPTATDPGRQRLGERYYRAMETSPDAYLDEFFRRLDDIAGAPAGLPPGLRL